MSGMSFDDLQTFNPELRDEDVRSHTTLPRGYQIFVPPTHAESLQTLWAPKQTRRPVKKSLTTSRVAKDPAS
jgi:hypothetical protein